MKFDFNFKPAAEIPAAEALRPAPVKELNAAPAAPMAFERLDLLARRNIRRARRAARGASARLLEHQRRPAVALDAPLEQHAMPFEGRAHRLCLMVQQAGEDDRRAGS